MAVLVGMYTPLVSIRGPYDPPTFTMLGLGRLGAPAVPLFIAGAVVLLGLGLLPDRIDMPAVKLAPVLLALTFAETIGVALDLVTGLVIAVANHGDHDGTHVTYRVGLQFLIVGLVLLLSGAFDRWRAGPTSAE
ncbi:hypothetical protein [Nocardia concava]|uniref:hypothetical protein n=1 Tax=Nocardia concava TaxID=257281 RepID=UPI0012FBFE83|nr:hypothetical protein [Nocardia concava]